VVLNGGRVEQVGSPMELFHRPATEFVEGFIGSPSMNILGAESSMGQAAKASGSAAKVGIRPEHIVIGETGLNATIRVKEQLGGECFLYLSTDDGAQIVVKTDGEFEREPGDSLNLTLPANRVHQFGADGRTLND